MPVENLDDLAQGMIIERVTDSATLRAVFQLRFRAWTHDGVQVGRGGEWRDPHDDHAMHWVIQEGSELVAAARLCVHRDPLTLPDSADLGGLGHVAVPLASLNRTVVHPDFRGHGYATLLLAARLETARQIGCRSVVAVTAPARVQTFVRLGFVERSRSSCRATVPLPGVVLVASL